MNEKDRKIIDEYVCEFDCGDVNPDGCDSCSREICEAAQGKFGDVRKIPVTIPEWCELSDVEEEEKPA